MKVKVKTNFYGQPEFEIGMPTLKKVLFELSKRIKFSILSDGEVHSDFKVYLNGVDYEGLPRGIETELNDGDKVEIVMVVLAGG